MYGLCCQAAEFPKSNGTCVAEGANAITDCEYYGDSDDVNCLSCTGNIAVRTESGQKDFCVTASNLAQTIDSVALLTGTVVNIQKLCTKFINGECVDCQE